MEKLSRPPSACPFSPGPLPGTPSQNFPFRLSLWAPPSFPCLGTNPVNIFVYLFCAFQEELYHPGYQQCANVGGIHLFGALILLKKSETIFCLFSLLDISSSKIQNLPIWKDDTGNTREPPCVWSQLFSLFDPLKWSTFFSAFRIISVQ